ncbi:MAG: response regulator [Desulfarculus sp.]|nr:response regulator [Desulfarculus sp.]
MYVDYLFLVSSGPTLVAAVAYSMAVAQFWFFLKKKRSVWLGWGAAACLAAAIYNTIIFLNFQTNNIATLAVLHRALHSVILLMLYAVANFIYSFLAKGSRLRHHLFLLSLLFWLAMIWFSPYIIVDHLVSRASLWVGGYYPRPTMRPLGLVMQAYIGAVICHLIFIWPWRTRSRLPHFPYLASGMIFWAVLALHDILVSMGMHARLFLAEYGVLGFCFSLAGFSITNYLSMEQSLRRSQKLQAMATLAAGVAHDFNNLLQVISANTERLLQTHTPAPVLHECLTRIAEAAQRGSELVRGLLSLGRQGPAQLTLLNLNQEIRRITGMLATALPSQITLTTDLAPNLPLILGNPTQIEQALLNLALNARDAMPQGGNLVLATRELKLNGRHAKAHPLPRPGEYVLLTVADTGQGMDQEILARAFDPFFSTKSAGQGSGLGLATVQGIMEAHGGAIACQSGPGQGTRFSLYWPAGPQPLPAPPPLPLGHSPAPARGRSLLLVDDEVAVLDSLGELLSLRGYRVLKAQGGQEALAVFRAQPVGLVIMDLHMPGMAAPDLLGRLLGINPQVKVIVVSGDLAEAQETLPTGPHVLAHLGKPVRVHQLQALIEGALQGRSSPRPGAATGACGPPPTRVS